MKHNKNVENKRTNIVTNKPNSKINTSSGKEARQHSNRKQHQTVQGKGRSARLVALEILVKVEKDGAYSNLQLNRSLQQANLSRQDAALVTEIVYGTISRKLTIDFWLAKFVAKGLDKLQPWVHQLLRMSLYQLVWLDRIPAHAAVNEAVNIAKKKGHQGISGMVNGVLRNVLRRKQELSLDQIKLTDDAERLSVRHSFPLWLVQRWLKQYGAALTEQLLAASNTAPKSTIRVNTMKASVNDVLGRLQEQGIEASHSELATAAINVESGGNLAAHEYYEAGIWSLQDESSMLVAEVLNPVPGMSILDACAAPGGKSMHIGELMKGKGRLLANDLHEHKRKLIADQAKRLGLENIETTSSDAVDLAAKLPAASFDAVLLDAPCSGFGVIRRKPEIKWSKTSEDVDAIAGLQANLLEAMSKLVKPGGVLLYSTCTIMKEENEDQVAAFLSKHPEYKLDVNWPPEVLQRLQRLEIIDETFNGQLQLLPYHANSDGFFIARLIKANS